MKAFLISMGLLLLPQLAAAQTVCEPVAQETRDASASLRLKALLRDKQFAAIEDELNGKLKRYQRGDYSDLVLYWDVDAAMSADPAFEPLLNQWVASQPQSFFARMLKGTHHAAMGYAKRGGDFSSNTSAEQLAAMRVEFAKANTELKEALALKADSALPLAGLIMISRATESAKQTGKLLTRANQVDPANTAARWTAVHALAPKWGGSFEELDGIASTALQARLPDAKVRYLQYAVQMQKANHFEVVTQEKAKAILHWRNAAGLCATDRPWGLIVSAAYDLEDWKTVKEASQHLLRTRPNDGAVLQRRGWADEKMGQMSDALKDYEAAAELGEPWAQNRLGYFLMVGQHVPKDIQRARQLLAASAAKGNANARANLEALAR